MYHTAVIRVYDVMDQIHVSAVITEYPSTPGTLPPIEYVLSATIPGRGEPEWRRWLLEGLGALAAEANS